MSQAPKVLSEQLAGSPMNYVQLDRDYGSTNPVLGTVLNKSNTTDI